MRISAHMLYAHEEATQEVIELEVHISQGASASRERLVQLRKNLKKGLSPLPSQKSTCTFSALKALHCVSLIQNYLQ